MDIVIHRVLFWSLRSEAGEVRDSAELPPRVLQAHKPGSRERREHTIISGEHLANCSHERREQWSCRGVAVKAAGFEAR